VVEHATLAADILEEYCGNGLLDASKLFSKFIVSGVHQVRAPFLEALRQQKLTFIVDELPHVKDFIVGLYRIVCWLLDAKKLHFVSQHQLISPGFLCLEVALLEGRAMRASSSTSFMWV
jgi:hypothetical protein